MTPPLADRPLIAVVAVVYLAAVAAVGVWALGRTRTPRDFFVAGPGVGVLAAGVAAAASSFSGFVFVGGPGLTYRMGVTSLLICLPVGFTSGMMCWAVGKRLRLLAEVREVYTIPDAVAARWGRRPAGWAALAVVLGTVGYLGAQLLALGRLLDAVLGGAGLAWAMALGLAVVLFYSVAGGMIAGVYTDLLQGAVMVIAALAVFAYAVAAGGGWTGLVTAVAADDRFGRGFFDPLGGAPALTALGFFFVFGVGALGQPHVVHKFYMLRDARRLKWLPVVIGGSQSACILIWLGIGLAVPSLVVQGRLAPLAAADAAAPAFLFGFVPPALAGLVFAGVLAAIMSTADSFISIGAAALVRDLPRALGRRLEDELTAGRWASVAVALVAALFAYAYDDLVALLGTFAFGTFAAALAPVLAVGLNWRRVPPAAATASIATGLGLNVALELLADPAVLPALPRPLLAAGALPSAVALAASFTVLFMVTGWHRLSRRRQLPLAADVAAVMEL